MGDLQCDPNATAGEMTVTTNSVTTNKNFNIRIVANNSRGFAKSIENIGKLVIVNSHSTLLVQRHASLSLFF